MKQYDRSHSNSNFEKYTLQLQELICVDSRAMAGEIQITESKRIRPTEEICKRNVQI